MAYKLSKGKRGFGDISFEDDSDTGIDFEPDTVKIETAGQERVVVSNNNALLRFSNSVVKNALHGDTQNTAVLEDTTFAGIGSADFSVSFWWYANDTHSGDTISSNSRVLFYDGNAETHSVVLKYPDVRVVYENTAGSNDYGEYDTNHAEQTWYHIVAHFSVSNLSSGVPRLWQNGSEINGTGYSAVGGSTPTIDKVKVYLDDGAAIQDLVFWNKLLTSDEIAEIYNSGNYVDPRSHSAASNIISWFKLGYEDEWASWGYSAGDNIDGERSIPDAIGTNEFTLHAEFEFALMSRTVTETSQPALDVDSSSIRIRNQWTPSSASDMGQQGEICWDANYLYICIATDTWKRVALSTW